MAPAAAKRRGKAGTSASTPQATAASQSKNGSHSGRGGMASFALALVSIVALGVLFWGFGGSGGGGGSSSSSSSSSSSTGTSAAMWVTVGASPLSEPTLTNVTCTPRRSLGACNAPRSAGRCARVVVDNAVAEAEAREVRDLIEWLIQESWGGGSGPPSVVDLHQGSISYKEQFVELAALMEFKQINFTETQRSAYHAVRQSLKGVVARQFGVPEEALLHDMTFFSHINGSKEAKTVHDEYWHQHIDTEQYGTFEYTALLYLSTMGEDFDGGEFVFDSESEAGKAGGPEAAVEPRFNRLVAFTSDAENPHRVERVSRGVRIALTSAFTCNEEKARSIGEAFPPKRPEPAE